MFNKIYILRPTTPYNNVAAATIGKLKVQICHKSGRKMQNNVHDGASHIHSYRNAKTGANFKFTSFIVTSISDQAFKNHKK